MSEAQDDPAETTTSAPPEESTTAAPVETTTAPPETTTTAPATTTTQPETTTTAPSTTTTQPQTTTTAPSTTTTQPQTTTTAPSTTTTQPQTTTTAPSTTTTSGQPAPTIDSFTGAPNPDDGASQLSDSLQIEEGALVELSWSVSNADSVELTDPAQDSPDTYQASVTSAEVAPQSETQDYTLVAISGDLRSEPRTVHVSTHAAGQVYSPHATVSLPSTEIATLVDAKGKPSAGTAYRITLADGSTREGAADAQGKITLQGVNQGDSFTLVLPDCEQAPASAADGTQPQPEAQGGSKRDAILSTAQSFIGKVADQGGEGGKRKGWQILKDIFDTSLNYDVYKDPKAQVEIPKAGGNYCSWCGIFALAMTKKSGAVPHEIFWQIGKGIQGIPQQKGNTQNIKPGDIIVVDSSLWHHAIVKEIDGDTFHTIDGNSTDFKTFYSQTICEHTRQRGEILAWYRTVADE